MSKVTCNASGFVMDINEKVRAEYRENGWDLPEDFNLADDAVTWVNGDYHKAVEDATWPAHLPYWEAGAELFA